MYSSCTVHVQLYSYCTIKLLYSLFVKEEEPPKAKMQTILKTLVFIFVYLNLSSSQSIDLLAVSANISDEAVLRFDSTYQCGVEDVTDSLIELSTYLTPEGAECVTCLPKDYALDPFDFYSSQQCITTSDKCAGGYTPDSKLLSELTKVSQYVKSIARSCQDVYNLDNTLSSGEYDILSSDGTYLTVYCDFDIVECGDGVWTRVASIDMSRSGNTCPSGLTQYTIDGLSHPVCDRVHEPYGACDSTFFSTYGISYSHVCGRVRGYAYGIGGLDGIYPNHESYINSIDSYYVDGISITYGSPRNHIWTYAGGQTDDESNYEDCPCNLDSLEVSPSYVGGDYYCEAGSSTLGDPLWDGQGCGNLEYLCCTYHNLPWFTKNLGESTTDDIELRACTSEGYPDEATPIDIIELYIR